MKVTGTGIAVALAVVIALSFMFFGPSFFTPLTTTPAATDMSLEQQPAATAMNPTNEPLPTTLTVTDTVVGTGAEAQTGDTVTVHYVGALPDGTIFDASTKRGEPFTFPLGGHMVISGWDKGIVGMKEGGTRVLVIPPDEGYGATDHGPIPGNSTLIFQVQLLSVQKGQ